MVQSRPFLFLILIGVFPMMALTRSDSAENGDSVAASHWPQWRGVSGNGSQPNSDPPIHWSETENIRWKTELPGQGHASPIVWGDNIFVTTSIPVGEPFEERYSGAPGAHDNLPITRKHQFAGILVDRKTGKIVWKKTLNEAIPHEGGHTTASLASQSPVTDGVHWYAYFGSHGLFCLDSNGDVVWEKQLGKMQTKHGHGEGSSPVLWQDRILINWDHEGQSFLVALDKSNGKELWRVERNEVTSWSTPLVIKDGENNLLVVCGTARVRAYDLMNGSEVWECGGLSANIVASPVADNGVVYVGSSYDTKALLAIQFEGARGDLTDSKRVLWERMRGTPYVPSLLLHKDSLYFLTHYQGILTKVQAKTGQDQPGAMRLGGIRNIYASPVASRRAVYITDLQGNTIVISDGEIPRILSFNQLDDSFHASAALVDDEIFLRGKKFLYCIASDEPTRSR